MHSLFDLENAQVILELQHFQCLVSSSVHGLLLQQSSALGRQGRLTLPEPHRTLMQHHTVSTTVAMLNNELLECGFAVQQSQVSTNYPGLHVDRVFCCQFSTAPVTRDSYQSCMGANILSTCSSYYDMRSGPKLPTLPTSHKADVHPHLILARPVLVCCPPQSSVCV